MPRPKQIIPTFGMDGAMRMRGPKTEVPLYCGIFINPQLLALPEEEREKRKDEFPDVIRCWSNAYEFSVQSDNYQVLESLPPDALLPPIP